MPSGILLLDKPLGLSSNAVLQRVRALLLRQKAGHVGSLDPLATGMLPICLGEATKIAGQILAGRKRYRFTVALGSGTRSEEHTSELQSLAYLVCRLLLEKKKKIILSFSDVKNKKTTKHN